MKRTTLFSNVVLMSVVYASSVSPLFAGGKGGNNGGGNFRPQVVSSFSKPMQSTSLPKNFGTSVNTGIVSRVQSQPINVNRTIGSNVVQNGIKVQNLQPLNGNQRLNVTQHSALNTQIKSVVGAGNGTGNAGNNNQGNQTAACIKTGGCFPKSCCNNWWYSPLWLGYGYGCWNPGYCYGNYCGYGYGYDCFYGSYGVPVYTTPVVVSGTTTTTPVIVNIETKEAQATAAATSPTTVTQTVPKHDASEENVREMILGKSYDLAGTSFGDSAGRMLLEVNDIALGLKVDQWTSDKVSFTLPMFGLAKATPAKIHLIDSTGKLAQTTTVRLALPEAMMAQQ